MRASRPVHALALVIATGSIACSVDIRGNQETTREEKRFTVSADAPVDLKVLTFDGAIVVKSWDQNEVLVEIERRAADQAAAAELVVNQTQNGNTIVLEAPRSGERNVVSFGMGRSVNFTVTAPRRMTLEARSGDGSIDVQNLQGTIDLNSGDGRIDASNVDGKLKVHTGDGSIHVDRAAGAVDADSGDGGIEIDGRLDELAVQTGDGSVRVGATDGSTMKTEWRITTGDGRIQVRLPREFNAAIDAQTGDGSVRVDGVDESPRSGSEPDRRRVVGQMGSGGATLRLRSGDGSIDVSR